MADVGFSDLAFLKAAVFRMLHKHCESGAERLLAFISDFIGGNATSAIT